MTESVENVLTNLLKFFILILDNLGFDADNLFYHMFPLGAFMEFIKKMRKREFIEASIKMAIAVLACFVAVVLMCGMIYSIGVKSYMKYGKGSISTSTETTAYCIEVKEDQYFVLYYNPNSDGSKLTANAITDSNLKTKEQCENLTSVKEIKFGAPSAFIVLNEFVEGWHIAIMAVIVAGVLSYFVYKFIKLDLDYKKVIDRFEKTGEIEIENA